ncbi:MAG: beta strand repeat-containing protein [Limisphaerales bacterium]
MVLTTNATGTYWGVISNFAGASVSGNPIITNGNLTYPGLPASAGNSLYVPPATGNMGRMSFNFPVVSTGQCYYSFLLKLTDISAVSSSPSANLFAAFGDNVGPQRAAVARAQSYVVAEKSGVGYVLGVGKNKPSTANQVYDTTVRNVGDVVFVVASYDYATTGHPANLWINPSAASFGASTPPTPTLTVTSGTDLNSPGIQSLMIGCFTNAPPGCVIDDIRVATSWAVVTGAPDLARVSTGISTNAGATVIIPSLVVGMTPLTYQWFKGTTQLANGGNISGSTSSALTVSNVTANDADNYNLVAGNSYGTTTAQVASLSVTDPSINSQPNNKAVPPGTSVTFQVGAAGVAPLSYRWNKDGANLSDGGNISGATSATLSVSSVSFADQGSYTVFVQNGLGTTTQSAVAVLTVNDPAITSQPQSVTNNYGTTATFSVTAVGLTTRSYQWKKVGGSSLSDGGNISGSHTSSLTLTGVSYLDAGSYMVTVTDNAGPIDSDPASLTVIEPIITSQPVAASSIAGAPASFSVAAIGAAPITYQWRKNGTPLSDGGNIVGSATSSLTVSSTSAGDAGSYSVSVGDASGANVVSGDGVLTVFLPPTIASQPSSRVIVSGNNAAFAVAVNGTTPFTYQWLSNGVTIPNATAFGYTLSNVQSSMSASYAVIVSNSYGGVTSAAATLAVVPSIRLFPTNLIVVRVGDGAQTPTFNGNSVFLDQLTTNGTYVNTVSIPDTGASALIEMGPDANGSTITGTALTRTPDKNSMVFGGYHTAAPFSTSLFNSSATAVPRGVGVIDGAGQFTLAVTDTTAYSGTYFRGAAFDGTNNFWGAGNTGGTYYFGLSQPATNIQSSFPNLRSTDIFNGNLYAVSGSSSGIGVLQWNGLPTSSSSPTDLFIPGSTPTDMCVDSTGTIIYLGTAIGVMRYQVDGQNWNFAYTLTGSAIRYLTVDFSSATPVIYATTSDSSFNRLLQIVDNSGSPTITTLVTAGVNQNLRGVRFGPNAVAAAPVITLTRNGSNVVLTWDPPYSLQSSTDVAGTFTNVVGATSPYTVNVSAATKAFFKVK